MQVTGNKVLTNAGLTIVHLVVPNLVQITLQTNLDIGPMQTMPLLIRLWTQSNIICNIIIVTLFYG